MADFRTRGCAGRNTNSSVPGGIFAKNAEVDGRRMLAYKQALDGSASGRFNSSGITGGIFASDNSVAVAEAARMRRTAAPERAAHMRSSAVGGPIAASAPPQHGAPRAPSAPRDVGPILGGGGVQLRRGGDEQPAAGGRSSNARPDGIGHTRGNLHGAHTTPLLEKAAGSRTVEGAFAKFLRNGPAALTQQFALPVPIVPSHEDADFLERVHLAETRDAEDAVLLKQLQELEAQSGLIEAAAAQIAAEEQLDPAQQAALTEKMLAHVSEQAHKLRTLLLSPRQTPRQMDGAQPRPANQRRQSPTTATGTLAGILAPGPPQAGEAAAEGPRSPIKGQGVCNPLVQYSPNDGFGIQYMPQMGGTSISPKQLGAAGAASSEAWRSSHNYMAHGAEGYGDFRSEHLALKASSKGQETRMQSGQRNLQTESKVVFGGNPGGLYPRSPSMIRGKYPGY